MGKKKQKRKEREAREAYAACGEGMKSNAGQAAGIAAALVRHAASPEGRQMLAAGLTMAAAAASAALTRPAPVQPTPPVPPHPDTPPPPPPPPPGSSSPGASGDTDPQAIAQAIGQAAEQLLGRFFGNRRN